MARSKRQEDKLKYYLKMQKRCQVMAKIGIIMMIIGACGWILVKVWT